MAAAPVLIVLAITSSLGLVVGAQQSSPREALGSQWVSDVTVAALPAWLEALTASSIGHLEDTLGGQGIRNVLPVHWSLDFIIISPVHWTDHYVPFVYSQNFIHKATRSTYTFLSETFFFRKDKYLIFDKAHLNN